MAEGRLNTIRDLIMNIDPNQTMENIDISINNDSEFRNQCLELGTLRIQAMMHINEQQLKANNKNFDEMMKLERDKFEESKKQHAEKMKLERDILEAKRKDDEEKMKFEREKLEAKMKDNEEKMKFEREKLEASIKEEKEKLEASNREHENFVNIQNLKIKLESDKFKESQRNRQFDELKQQYDLIQEGINQSNKNLVNVKVDMSIKKCLSSIAVGGSGTAATAGVLGVVGGVAAAPIALGSIAVGGVCFGIGAGITYAMEHNLSKEKCEIIKVSLEQQKNKLETVSSKMMELNNIN